MASPAPTPVAAAPRSISQAQAADVQVAMGRMLEERGQIEPAIQIYTQAAKKDGQRADACARLAVLHDKQGKFTESAKLYDRALTLQPNDPDVLADRGYSYYLQERWQEAEKDLRQALRLKPDHKRARNNLGLVLARSGKTELALAAFRQAGCSEAEARVNLGYAMTLGRSWGDAAEHYEAALALDPACTPARKGLNNLKRVVAKLEAKPGGKAVEEAPTIVQASATRPFTEPKQEAAAGQAPVTGLPAGSTSRKAP